MAARATTVAATGGPSLPDVDALKKKFKNFDLEEVYDEVKKAAVDEGAQNFVVQFGPSKARIALNLNLRELKGLKHLPAWKDEECPIHWINFWNTTKQKDAIEDIGEHYGFTRRLRASIVAWDKFRHITRNQPKKKTKPEPEEIHTTADGRDLEQGLNGAAGKQARSKVEALQPRLDSVEYAYFKLVQSSMNYTTVDHGEKFTCIGANWLHRRPCAPGTPGTGRLVPPKHWSWLTLCMSGMSSADTVISINEAPNLEDPPEGVDDPRTWKKNELAAMRRNTFDVLQQISYISDKEYKKSALSLKAIRAPLRGIPPGGSRTSTTVPHERMAAVGASNLFYYLFEDTFAVVPILDEVKTVLEHLTQQVLQSPYRMGKRTKSNIIPQLHDLGKDLRLLKHLFESYKALIQTILAPPDTDVSERVQLEQQSRDRFRRLGDRLQLLMLNTIGEYLDEKSELSSTYFNLTAQKDSQATSRLTQSATLLAKLSVFFLPISFLTSYFSIEIPGMMDSYTSNTYWISFGVIAFLSFLSLFFFSRFLIGVSEQLDAVSKRIDTSVLKTFSARMNRNKARDDTDHDDDDD